MGTEPAGELPGHRGKKDCAAPCPRLESNKTRVPAGCDGVKKTEPQQANTGAQHTKQEAATPRPPKKKSAHTPSPPLNTCQKRKTASQSAQCAISAKQDAEQKLHAGRCTCQALHVYHSMQKSVWKQTGKSKANIGNTGHGLRHCVSCSMDRNTRYHTCAANTQTQKRHGQKKPCPEKQITIPHQFCIRARMRRGLNRGASLTDWATMLMVRVHAAIVSVNTHVKHSVLHTLNVVKAALHTPPFLNVAAALHGLAS